MKLKIFFVLFTVLIVSNLFSQQLDTEPLDVPLENNYHLKHFKKIYNDDVLQLNEFLSLGKFKEAQSLLSKIQEKIFYDFQEQLKVCFPLNYQSLKLVETSKLSQGEFEKVDFGVLFTQRYADDNGKSLEINIVDAEQSAQDYKDLILKPELIEGLENTSLVSYDSFKAIQTIDMSVKHQEQNILLSNQAVMTIVAIGIDDESFLANFVNEILFDKLKQLID